MTDQELKPCPFCGGVVVEHKQSWNIASAKCTDCEEEWGFCGAIYPYRYRKWNMRAPSPQQINSIKTKVLDEVLELPRHQEYFEYGGAFMEQIEDGDFIKAEDVEKLRNKAEQS